MRKRKDTLRRITREDEVPFLSVIDTRTKWPMMHVLARVQGKWEHREQSQDWTQGAHC